MELKNKSGQAIKTYKKWVGMDKWWQITLLCLIKSVFAYTQYYVNVFKEFLRSKSVNFSRIWYRGFKHNEKEIMSGGENYFKGVGSLF